MSGQPTPPPYGLRLVPAKRPLRALSSTKKRHFAEAARGQEGSDPISCGFCQRDGHSTSRCPSTPTPIPDSFSKEERAFAGRIMSLPQVDIEAEFEGLSWEQAREKVTALAALHNAGNPWAGSEKTRDRLRAQAGWWKAIGADRTVLS